MQPLWTCYDLIHHELFIRYVIYLDATVLWQDIGSEVVPSLSVCLTDVSINICTMEGFLLGLCRLIFWKVFFNFILNVTIGLFIMVSDGTLCLKYMFLNLYFSPKAIYCLILNYCFIVLLTHTQLWVWLEHICFNFVAVTAGLVVKAPVGNATQTVRDKIYLAVFSRDFFCSIISNTTYDVVSKYCFMLKIGSMSVFFYNDDFLINYTMQI